ncbi:MAG: flagellar biosynthesis anti-sigma factor FlgM [Gemmataceae bacterium]|nr:flagellar biosynthesis anti-sigma factor FlgM [Gemmataceae bacterium]
MRTHNPTCLEGPITGTRNWWHMAEPELPPRKATRQGDDEPLFRAGLVEEVRREIAAGTYDTPEKWESALERLLKRLDEAGD